MRAHHRRLVDETLRAYASAGDDRPASDRVADHLERLESLVDDLWAPPASRGGFEAKIAAAEVVFRTRPRPA